MQHKISSCSWPQRERFRYATEVGSNKCLPCIQISTSLLASGYKSVLVQDVHDVLVDAVEDEHRYLKGIH